MGRACKETVCSACLVSLIGCFGLLMAGCGSLGGSSDSGGSAPTDLTITVWPQGPSGPSREWTLQCDPGVGSLPDAAKACASLTAELLRPLPPDTICTQIYGGPQTARVQGRFEGRDVDVRYGRANGCEIHRWDSARFLFPVKI
jgi:Subtilisin inhibitor-like